MAAAVAEAAPETAPPPSPAPPPGTAVAFAGVSKKYGAKTILADVSLAVAAGTFTVLYGPPASGKSVLMRILMGLEEPTAGRVALRGHDVTRLPAADRGIGYIPQSFALYPHLSVRDNIAYPLKLAGVGEHEAAPVVQHAAEMLHIPDLLAKRPDQLSGGQKQRVAIARGLAKQTDVYVFDDPLAGLDFKLREQLVEDLRDLQQEWRATFLYTTSDAIEALTLADQLAVLDGAVVVEHGPPHRLYADPRHLRAMALVGFPPANLLPGRLLPRDGALWCETALFDFPTDVPAAASPASQEIVVGLRPEGMGVGAAAREWASRQADQLLRLDGRVILREDLGGEEIIYLQAEGVTLTAVDRHHGGADLDAQVPLAVHPRDLFVFATGSGKRLGRGTAAPIRPANGNADGGAG